MDAIDWHSSIAVSFDKGYQTTPRFMERLSVWNAAIERWLPIGGAVLDAGCGSGVLSLVAAQRAGSVVAFDGSEEMIRIARGKALPANSGTVTFEVASLSEISNFGAGVLILLCPQASSNMWTISRMRSNPTLQCLRKEARS